MDCIGIDVHKRESQIYILADTGEIQEVRIRTTRERFTAVLGNRTTARILLEAATESEWVAQCLELLGHEVIVADPNYAPMYPDRRRRVKTDRRDAAALAEACRTGTYRAAHRLSAAQREVRRHLCTRDHFVRTRVRTVVLIRALLRGEGLRIRGGMIETFLGRLRELDVPDALQVRLAPLVACLEFVNAQIAAADTEMAAITAANPLLQRLATTPGVGPVTSAAFVAVLDRVDRFRSPQQVASYIGLVPREASSADRRHRGHITKAGNSRLRWLLVQSAWGVIRCRKPAAIPLRTWAERIAQRRGRSIAVVALARRLAGLLFILWRDGTTYDPGRLRMPTGSAAA